MPIFDYHAQRLDGSHVSGEVFAWSAQEALSCLGAAALQVQELQQQPTPDVSVARASPGEAAVVGMHSLAVTDDLVSAIRAYSTELPWGWQRYHFRRWLQQLERAKTSEAGRASAIDDPLLPWVASEGAGSGARAALLAIRHGQQQADQARVHCMPFVFPLTLAAIMVGIVLLISLLLRPLYVQISEFFGDLEAQVPAITRFVLTWQGLPLVLACMVTLLALLWLLLRYTGGVLVRPIPWVGHIVDMIQQARFLRRLSAGIALGQPVPEALRVAAAGSRSRTLRRAVRQWSGPDAAGDAALSGYGSSFPATARYALQAQLPPNERACFLRQLADDRQSAVQQGLFGISGILEPICMLAVYFVVFLIVLAVYAPLISLIENLS